MVILQIEEMVPMIKKIALNGEFHDLVLDYLNHKELYDWGVAEDESEVKELEREIEAFLEDYIWGYTKP